MRAPGFSSLALRAMTTSRFWCVSWYRRDERWLAQWRDANGKTRTIGYFDDEEDDAASGLPVHARSRCRYFAHAHAVAIEAIRTVRRRARSGPRPIRSARRGSNRSWSAPCTRTYARDCPLRNPSTLATARTRALLPGNP